MPTRLLRATIPGTRRTTDPEEAMTPTPTAALRQIGDVLETLRLARLSDGQLLQRFAHRRDERAFAALVGRHGRTVLNVCRRVLADPNDADDVFQAAFLALARRAGSLRRPEAVGGWLYAVAHRLALKVRSEACRRRDREAGA